VRHRGLHLQDRDVEILLALAKMRLLRTSDIGMLYFDAVGTAQKRLRKLYDAGLVRAIVTDLAAENRYALTPLGHALLEEAQDGADVPAFRPAPRVDAACIGHLDFLNRYRIALARGCADHGIDLVRFAPEWDLRAQEPHAELVPDAAVVLSLDGSTVEVALEVDTGSEPPRTVTKKLERYDAARLARRAVAGLVAPVVLIVVLKARRARALARAVAGPAEQIAMFGSVPWVLVDGGLTTGTGTIRHLASRDGELGAADFPIGLRDVLGASGVARSRVHETCTVAVPLLPESPRNLDESRGSRSRCGSARS
jgi:hypothetical protein